MPRTSSTKRQTRTTRTAAPRTASWYTVIGLEQIDDVPFAFRVQAQSGPAAADKVRRMADNYNQNLRIVAVVEGHPAIEPMNRGDSVESAYWIDDVATMNSLR